jgi:hypothetical protein
MKYMFDRLYKLFCIVEKRNSGVSLSESFTVDPGKISFANSHSSVTENNKVKKYSCRRYLRIQDIVIGTVRRRQVFYDAVVRCGVSVNFCGCLEST